MSAGAAGAVVRQGHLRKLKTMKKKYFVLRAEGGESSARLEYYESEKKFRAGAAPRRLLPLKGCYNITRRLDLKQKHVIALFTREEQFCVVAEHEADLHAWLAAILRLHSAHDHSDELLNPIQHVWQVNVQKKGLGASKNIQGLYNLCLTDKTLTLVKIKSHNNVISDLGIPERVEYSLKNIRRCGDSECFFYMEVGRQTATGAGELWMHSDDSNIAQSMHSTIYHAMRNCAKETENEKDHIVIPGEASNPLPARRQTYSDGRGRAGLANAENQPPNNSLIPDKSERLIKHHRTVSLPTGCPFEPLKISHERTRSAPLTGDEVDRVTVERTARHSSCKGINGTEKKPLWNRRASTGARLSKLSPAHTKNAASTFRNRCDSMPSRACASLEVERPPPRHAELVEGLDTSRDETDTVAEWHRTPRIPEEPDYCEMGPRELFSKLARESAQHSRTSSIAASETSPEAVADGYLPMAADSFAAAADGYLPMAPLEHGLVSASSGSVCSGTPSTDPRFSEYQLEPAMSHIIDAEERPPRAYSVGSRPPPRADVTRHRAYSVGAHGRAPAGAAGRGARAASSAPLLPRASAEDLMELDFSQPPTPAKLIVARTPPSAGFAHPPRPQPDADTDSAGYVEMRPATLAEPARAARTPSRPAPVTSPAPRSALADTLSADAEEHHPLTTLREISEECARRSPELSSSPSYVSLSRQASRADSDPGLKTGTSALHYAALDLQPRAPAAPPAPRAYSQIDWRRSHLHARADH